MSGKIRIGACLTMLALLAGCATSPNEETGISRAPAPAGAGPQPAPARTTAPPRSPIPPSDVDAAARLRASTRHGEWARIPVPAAEGGAVTDTVRAWVVYPERSTKAPVVVVIHEIFGLTTWVRAVADQLAADGFIAIAPDLLHGERLPAPPDSLATAPWGLDSAVAVISALDYGKVIRRIGATGAYGTSLPSALPRWGVTGFCWGGSIVFATVGNIPQVGAAVAFYGGAAENQIDLSRVRTPTLGIFAEHDARVNATIPYIRRSFANASVTYADSVFAGAGHGFLSKQDAHDGANLRASNAAWPMAVRWFRQHLGG